LGGQAGKMRSICIPPSTPQKDTERRVSQKDVSEKSRLREKKVQLLKNSCTFSFAQKGFKLISY